MCTSLLRNDLREYCKYIYFIYIFFIHVDHSRSERFRKSVETRDQIGAVQEEPIVLMWTPGCLWLGAECLVLSAQTCKSCGN